MWVRSMTARLQRPTMRAINRIYASQDLVAASNSATKTARASRLFATSSEVTDEELDNFSIDEDCDLFANDDASETTGERDEILEAMFGSNLELLSGTLDVTSLPVVKAKDPKVEVGSVTLEKSVWGVPIRKDIVHRIICWQRAQWRQGTSKTKSRGEVRGGGKKPWVQKGTGRARHGSIRSPIWRGGGHAHAKRPRDWSHKLNRKVLKMGLRVALSAKCKEGNITIIDEASVPEIKTSNVADLIEAHGWAGEEETEGALLLDSPLEPDFELAARNIPARKLYAQSVDELVSESNVYDIVLRERLVLTRAAFEDIQERLRE